MYDMLFDKHFWGKPGSMQCTNKVYVLLKFLITGKIFSSTHNYGKLLQSGASACLYILFIFRMQRCDF